MSATGKKHIVIVCTGLNVVGGLERMVVSFANLLTENGYKISLLIVGDTTESFYSISDDIKITLLDADFGINSHVNYIKRKIHFVTDIIKFRNLINNINPHIVITTEYVLTVAAVLGKLNSNIKLICWQHNIFTIRKSSLWDKASKYAYRKVDYIVALNKDEEKSYQAFNSNTIVIPNFTESLQTFSSSAAKQLLTIARFTAVKGIDLLIQTAAIVLNRYPDWQWKLIGKGNLAKEYSQHISKYGLPKNLIVQLPVSHQINEEYTSAGLYVMTSRNELFPLVLLEAMSHGVPCVAFDCDTGPRHIITNNIDGILVEKENPEKLAAAIGTLIEDKEKRSQMGKAAFENVKRFSSDVILKQWEDLFQRLLSS